MGAADQAAAESAGRWLTVPRTLAFVCHGDDVLLLRRRADSPIYPGRYNGVGGHLERHEDPLSGVRREILEETGLHVSQLRLRAIYHIDPDARPGALLFVFTCQTAIRALHDTAEGRLRWVPRSELLTLPLVEDLPHMLPRLLAMAPDAPPLFVHASYDDADRLRLNVAADGLPPASAP